jgi:rod shape-determining protein MreD
MMRPGRLALLIVTLVIVQVTVVPHVRAFGVVPDLGLVLAVAVAYRFGPVAGALTGFAAGLGYDVFLETPLALTALAYAVTAYGVGVVQSGMLRAPRWIPPLLGLAAGLASGFAFIGVGGLAGVSGMWTAHALTVVALAACYDAVIALLIFPLVNGITRNDPELTATRSARG